MADELGPKAATALRLLGMNSEPAQPNPLSQFGSQPELRSYDEPWYRRFPNALTDLVYGDNANAQQAEWMRTLFGPANPFNIPGQVAEGVDTARTGYQIGSPALMGAGAVAAMAPFLPGPKMGGRVAKEIASQAMPKGIRAYHGSPHDFDAFDASKIGSGEGNQAFGHGHYFAANEDVARTYRNMLTRDQQTPVEARAQSWIDAHGGREQAIAQLESIMASDAANGTFRPKPARVKKDAELLGYLKSGASPVKGRIYEVNINADPEHFLDWDRRVSEQSPSVLERLRKGGADEAYFTGDRQAERLPEIAAYDAAKLREAGIPGIKYLDKGSRQAGEGTRNYVVFPGNEHLIEILRKYGLVGAIGLGGYGASGASDQEHASP